MALRARLAFSRLVPVSISLCAFVALPLPQLNVPMWTESSEAECPFGEDREGSEEERIVCSSARRRLKHRRHIDLSRSNGTRDRLHQIASYAGHLPTIVGHQFANDLHAPLVV